MTQKFPSGCVSQRIESRVSKRYLYTYVHSSIIHNNRKAEATLMSKEINGSYKWCVMKVWTLGVADG